MWQRAGLFNGVDCTPCPAGISRIWRAGQRIRMGRRSFQQPFSEARTRASPHEGGASGLLKSRGVKDPK